MWVALQSAWASLRTRPLSTDISRIDEESFILLEGEIEATFRGVKSAVKDGKTVHIPAKAPHQFHNTSSRLARLLCICSPAGQEEFFAEVGVPVATRTTPPPKLDAAAQAEFRAKAEALAPEISDRGSAACGVPHRALRRRYSQCAGCLQLEARYGHSDRERRNC